MESCKNQTSKSYTDIILKNVGRHIQLTEQETDFFLSILEEKKLKKREYLLKAGETYEFENYIVKGCLRTYYLDQKNTEHVIYLAIEDYWSGDLYSFWTGKPTRFNIEALENTTLFRIRKNNIDLLLERVPKFERFFRILLKNSMVSEQQRILQNLSFTAEERYLAFQKRYPGMELRISQKQIASFLGVTPEFLSALRKRLPKR
jgi:CRP-like cAMP-binding protein